MNYLFRAKSKATEEWCYGMPYYGRNKVYIMVSRSKFVAVLPDTIGQHIGTCDKYNTLIYEGDILHSLKNDKLYVVTKSEKTCSFVVESIINPFHTKNITKDDDEKQQNRVIVGNIYDNPELLVVED